MVLDPITIIFLERFIYNGLSNNPNGYHTEKLHPREVGVPTDDFKVDKTLSISSSRIMLRVNYRVNFSYYLHLGHSRDGWKDFSEENHI